MTLVRSNGKELVEVYDISGPIYWLSASMGPINAHCAFILEDAAAREMVDKLTKAQHNPKLGVAE